MTRPGPGKPGGTAAAPGRWVFPPTEITTMPDTTEKTETKPIEGGEAKRTTRETKDGGGTTGTSVTEAVEQTVKQTKG